VVFEPFKISRWFRASLVELAKIKGNCGYYSPQCPQAVPLKNLLMDAIPERLLMSVIAEQHAVDIWQQDGTQGLFRFVPFFLPFLQRDLRSR